MFLPEFLDKDDIVLALAPAIGRAACRGEDVHRAAAVEGPFADRAVCRDVDLPMLIHLHFAINPTAFQGIVSDFHRSRGIF